MTAGMHEAVLADVPDEVSLTEENALDFDRLVVVEQQRIRGLAWRFGVPAEELDDVVQDVFIKAWAARNGFRGNAVPTTWLTRIAVNHLVSRRRKLKTRIAALANLSLVRMRGPRRPDSYIAAAEAEAKAAACVRRLSPKLRTVFVLRYLEEMSVSDVAQTLEIPEATVRSRALNARKKLRSMLKDYKP
jgi:RNA polymerase sigma-70 factor (ECF subfamily)